MDPSTLAAVLSNDPDDNTTGFKAGDRRGYFWIEVPRDGSMTAQASSSSGMDAFWDSETASLIVGNPLILLPFPPRSSGTKGIRYLKYCCSGIMESRERLLRKPSL